jgi:hypothetical protein
LVVGDYGFCNSCDNLSSSHDGSLDEC